jgi:hypothetical protein
MTQVAGRKHDCRHMQHTAARGQHCRKGVDLDTFRRAPGPWPCGNDDRKPTCALREELTLAEQIVANNCWAVDCVHTDEFWPLGRMFQRRDGVVAQVIPEHLPARVRDPNAALRRSICSGLRFGEQHVCQYPKCAGAQAYCDTWRSAEDRRIGLLQTGAAR